MKIRKRAKFMQGLDLPPDMAGGVSTVMLNGGCEVYINACKKILSYEDEFIKLKLLDSVLVIKGENFVLRSFSNGSVKIKGKIYGIERWE